VTTYYWNSKIAGGITSYNIDIANPNPHRAYDAITVDVGPTPVPEPGTYASPPLSSRSSASAS